MDFELTQDQRLLVDAVTRYLERQHRFEDRASRNDDAGWAALAELGLLGLPFDEAYGGGAGSMEDIALVMQALGKALVTAPYLATTIMAGTLLSRTASASQKDTYLSAMAGGEQKIVMACEEPHIGPHLPGIQSRYQALDDGYVVDGCKTGVLAATADKLIVLARHVSDEDYKLFIVPCNAPGVSQRSYRAMDGSGIAEFSLEQVRLPATALLGGSANVLAEVEFALDVGRVALCAEAVGIMESVVQDTAEYARNRRQFGVAIGSFQALQHKMVDMLVHTEQAKSIMWRALAHLDADHETRARECAGAKALIGTSARFVGQQAVQIHGGMGMTQEMKISHDFRRLTAIEQTLGNTPLHLRRVARNISQTRHAGNDPERSQA